MKSNWKTKKIGEIIISTATVDPRKNPGKLFNYIDVSSVSNRTLSIVGTTKLFGSDAPSRARRIVCNGDVIFATVRPTLRRIAIVPEHLDGQVCSTGYFVFRTNPDVEAKFLFYFLQTDFFMSEMEKLQSGTSYPAVNDTQVKQVYIKYPTTQEQKRIVAILDQAFADIEKIRANSEKNLKNARELFESYLLGVFGKKCVERNLSEIATILMGQSPPGDSYNTEGVGVPLINGPVEFGKHAFSKTIKSKFTTKPTKMCKRGDLILCVRGSTTGRMNIAGFDACIGRGVAAIRSEHYQNWINHYINFRRDYIFSLGTGSTFPNVSNIHLSELKIAIPSEKDMQIIIGSIEKLNEHRVTLEKIYNKKLSELNHLKKSLLHQAFTGQLTKQEVSA